ncbi:unnamed protein product [Arctogadus glacialis]
MHDSHVTPLVLLLSFFSVGLIAETVVPELETDEVVPMVLFGEDTHLLLQDQTRRYRDRRSPQDVPGGHDTTHKDHLLLLLPAFGNNLYLNLRSDNSFLSDNFVVEERKRGKSPQLSRIPQGQLCFYTGWIVNHTDSYASLSTCGGLDTPELSGS